MLLKKLPISISMFIALVVALPTMFFSAAAQGANLTLTGAVCPLGGVKPGRWVEARCQVTNRSGAARRLLTVISFKSQPNVQFAARLEIPAHCRRQVWIPVRSAGLQPGERSIWLHTLLVDDTVKPERVLDRQTGAMLVEQMTSPMAVLVGYNDPASMNLAEAMRSQMGLGKALFFTSPRMLPNELPGWGAVDCCLVGADNPKIAPLQLHIMRDWLAAGGRLWIQASPQNETFCAALLKQAFVCQTVAVIHTAHLHFTGKMLNQRVVLKRAVRLSCALPNGMKTLETVNGWPAVMETAFGRGRVYVCMLNGRGMLNAKRQGTAALWTAVQHFFPSAMRSPKSLLPQLHHFAMAQIGYQIVGRSAVAGILLAFTSILILISLWLYRRKRLERLALLGIAAAVLAVIGLTILGIHSRQAVPLTLSTAEMGYVVPKAKTLVFSGAADVYSPQQQNARINSAGGGVFWPDLTGSRETVVRMIWTDYNRWNWRGLQWPSGAVARGFVSGVRHTTHLREVAGSFGPDGLTLRPAPDIMKRLTDVLIAAPSGDLTVKPAAHGRWLAGTAQVLAPGQYVSSLVLGNRQWQRSQVFATLLSRRNFSAPVMLGWMTRVNPGLQANNDIRRQQNMLVEIPIKLLRSKTGGNVQIPAPYIHFRLVAGPGQVRPALVYNTQRKKWLTSLTNPTNIFVTFALPQTVLPIQVRQLQVHLLIHAPNRMVKVLLVQGTRWRVLKAQKGPIGEMDITQGGLNLTLGRGPGMGVKGLEVEIQVQGRVNVAHPWGISGLQAGVEGHVLARSAGYRRTKPLAQK